MYSIPPWKHFNCYRNFCLSVYLLFASDRKVQTFKDSDDDAAKQMEPDQSDFRFLFF